MASFLKHLCCAEDICLLSGGAMDLGQIALDLQREASSVELKKNINITKLIGLTDYPTVPVCDTELHIP